MHPGPDRVGRRRRGRWVGISSGRKWWPWLATQRVSPESECGCSLLRRGALLPCATPRKHPSRRPRRHLSGPRYARGWCEVSRGSARPPASWRRNPGRGVPDGAGCSLFLVILVVQVVFGIRERAGATEDLGVIFIYTLQDLRLLPGSGVGQRRTFFLWQAEELAHHIYVVQAGFG